MTSTREDERIDEDFLQHVHPMFALLRDESPVRPVRTPNGLRVWLVTRYDDVRAGLGDSRLSKDIRHSEELIARHLPGTGVGDHREYARLLNLHMLNTDPPDHTRLRRLVGRVFTARRVEQLRPRIEEITEQLLASMPTGVPVDLIEAFAAPLPITVICELLGVPTADRERFRGWCRVLESSVGGPELGRAGQAMADYLDWLCVTKRANPDGGLISALVQPDNDGDQLSTAETTSMAYLLLVAGHETTVNLIANGVLTLLTHPDHLARLQADPALVPAAVEEFLRYESPVTVATRRYTTEPVEIGGITIPAGEFVLLCLSSANRDPSRFPDANAFDPTRSTHGHLAFGHGIHFCLGAPLARLEGEIAFTQLLARLSSARLAVPAEQLRWRFSLLMHGLEELPVVLG
ncbi:cytochrome P450 family protein [Goodfellowiella coeruleoviolacea]|uniref:Cytochrome P450 n=1 Tax=Goodfellowiella coeruleoviolacea TaxID=334858 RepID=A0AAE3KJ47_9PSEU|nr:cytochrome P450 [Goodfellowiella coeruleoviolacea]MCP2163943.1 Cytochrome P450 [Goodfellowiella coeruleoviolacea]